MCERDIRRLKLSGAMRRVCVAIPFVDGWKSESESEWDFGSDRCRTRAIISYLDLEARIDEETREAIM